jgi:hypothetical protein
MMFRETPAGAIAISQPSHAWLAGQIVRAWGNAAFGRVTPYEDVCLGAEQHDIGWLLWEQSPTLNMATGRPDSFRDLSIAVHTGIWRQGTEMALALGRYPALLASLHGSGLYANFDFAAATSEDGAIVRDFLAGQQAIQRRLIESLGADRNLSAFSSPSMIERNRGLVRSADRMSIAVCTAMRDLAVSTDNQREAIIRQVPTAGGETDVHMVAIDGDAANVAVTPWPFASPVVTVTCEGIFLPASPFKNESEMRATLRNARRVALSAELIRGY